MNIKYIDITKLFKKDVNEKKKISILINYSTGIFTLMSLGLLGIGFGLFILIAHPYEFLFKWKVIFSDGGEIFELWRKPPVELYLKVYLFNVTNHEEFKAGTDDKLKFQEVGPYVYR